MTTIAATTPPPSPSRYALLYTRHAWDSLTVSQLQWAIISLPVWWEDSRDEYHDALAAWEARCTEPATRGLDYYADDAWWEACEAESR